MNRTPPHTGAHLLIARPAARSLNPPRRCLTAALALE